MAKLKVPASNAALSREIGVDVVPIPGRERGSRVIPRRRVAQWFY